MIEKGVNPFIVDVYGANQFASQNLAKSSLSNLPTKKSVFLRVRPFIIDQKSNTDFCAPWFYRTGVFGTFNSVIGQGASGTVLSGDWFGRKAAFKFVENGIRKRGFQLFESGLETLNKKISEMTSIQSTEGSKVVSFLGHYR